MHLLTSMRYMSSILLTKKNPKVHVFLCITTVNPTGRNHSSTSSKYLHHYLPTGEIEVYKCRWRRRHLHLYISISPVGRPRSGILTHSSSSRRWKGLRHHLVPTGDIDIFNDHAIHATHCLHSPDCLQGAGSGSNSDSRWIHQ